MRQLNNNEVRRLTKLLEVSAGPVGTPFDTAASTQPRARGFRSRDDEIWSNTAQMLKKYVDKLDDSAVAKLASMSSERRTRHVINVVGLDPKDDLQYDTVEEEMPRLLRMKKKSMTRINVARHVESRLFEARINNPSEMTHDDAVAYFASLNDTDVLINDMYIVDASEGEDDEIYGGYTVEQALIVLGDAQGGGRNDPRIDPRDIDDEEEFVIDDNYDDDPWSNDGPVGEREYDFDDVDFTTIFADIDPVTGEKTVDGVPLDDWMNESNYDLYFDVPMNIRRPDGGPFDTHDVSNIKTWVKKERQHRLKYNPGIILDVEPAVGDVSVDTEVMFT